jgi:GTP-binding protein HflX
MEKTVIVKVPQRQDEAAIASDIEEMKGLVATAGGFVVDTVIQMRHEISPGYYIGRGKAEEIAEKYGKEAALLVFDAELRPIQVKNLEDITGMRVIDRTQLILDIFAGRARTAEGKLQVEYAQLNYLLPRLSGRGSDFMQQTGGIGTRGPGETKLEVDRRHVRGRIQKIKQELESIRDVRGRQRLRRKSVPVPQIAIVGYTNAGKTMLLNSLTKAGMLSEDKLFATLDPKIKQYVLPSGFKVLFSDTVGFIKDLPTHLIAAFRATLEEVKEADIILHVIDISAPGWEGRRATVYSILKDIGADEDRNILEVFNKTDLLSLREKKALMDGGAIYISAATREGFSALLKELDRLASVNFVKKRIALRPGQEKQAAVFYQEGIVDKIEYKDNAAYYTVRAMEKTFEKFEKMRKQENADE